MSLLRVVIEKSKQSYLSNLEQEILDEMEEGIEGNESMNVCVCSFSEEQDSLSQWRAYTDSSVGVAIGFSGSFIKSVVDVQKCYFAPCLYEESDQLALIEALVEKVVKQNIEIKKTGEYEDFPLGGSLCAYMHRYAPILKDISFKEEKEWRIILGPLSCKSENYNFRTGRSMLVPYYKIPLIDINGDFYQAVLLLGLPPIQSNQKCP